MVTIYKYMLTITDSQLVSLPIDARILSVAEQNGLLMMWAAGDPTKPVVSRQIHIVGTGNPAEHVITKRFIGTVVMKEQPFAGLVWHVFSDF